MVEAVSLPRVAILLCTYNGARYLREQLESYNSQTVDQWVLHVSDDGSTDGTLDLLQAFPPLAGRLHIHAGPRQGFAANFLSLARRPDVGAQYFAFSDQDDIWWPDKLERALAWIESVPSRKPALYCSASRHIDAAGAPIGVSAGMRRPPGFRNALVQNIAGGNTMVFNAAAMELLRASAGAAVPVMAHDWWLYMLVTGCGGIVNYDSKPTLDYRQHDANLIGGRTPVPQRVRNLMAGRFRQWNEANAVALERVASALTEDSRRVVDRFAAARRAALPARLALLLRSGVYRQTLSGTLALWGAAVLGKI